MKKTRKPDLEADRIYRSPLEISTEYGINRNTIYRMIATNKEFSKLCVRRFGGKILINRNEFEKYIKKGGKT